MYVMSGKFHNLVKPFQSIHISCKLVVMILFVKNIALKENLVHAGKKTFQCNICEKLSLNNTSLNKHMIIQIEVELYFCCFLKRHSE